MKIRTNTRAGNKVTLEIETEHQEFAQAVEVALAEASREVNLPGFRPGKAPKAMVEKALNREMIEAHAAQHLISDLYPKILEEAALDPVDYPNVEVVQQETGKPFVFKIVLDVYPEVKLGKYKGLNVEKIAVKLADEEVEKVLGNLQHRFSKPGPDGQKELLPLDDEFAKQVSNFGTLAELKEEIKTAMLRDRQAEAEADLKNKLIVAAAAESKVEVPVGMTEREVEVMLDELRGSLAQSSLTLEDYLKGIKKEEKALREELRGAAEIRVRGKVVLKAIAAAEKMTVTTEELEAEFKNLATSTGEEIGEMKKRLDKEGVKFIEDYLLRQKALNFIMEKAKIKPLEETRGKPLEETRGKPLEETRGKPLEETRGKEE
jgi:FKBP-type peptidyl-prolyl cis-trans isomerase (trigger factor)